MVYFSGGHRMIICFKKDRKQETPKKKSLKNNKIETLKVQLKKKGYKVEFPCMYKHIYTHISDRLEWTIHRIFST